MLGDTVARQRPFMLQVCAADHMAYYSLRPLMRAARELGWIVEFACADGDYASALRDEGFVHRPVPMTRSLSVPRQAAAIAALTRELRRRRPDVVHTHTPIGGVVGRAAAKLAGVRGIVHTLHGLPFAGAPRTLSERLFVIAERALAPETALFLSQSSADAEAGARFGIAPPNRTVVIGNGVDLERFKPDAAARQAVRGELGIDPRSIVVTTVARLVREKGLLELADAALELHEDTALVFLVVGRSERSDRSHLENELATHPVARTLGDRWRLLGRRDDVEKLLQASDLFVLPTHREGLPRSVIEAMATGLPVVASDIPANRELVSDETGRLVPPRDPRKLAAAIGWVATVADRAAMGRRARDIAHERHDERRVVAHQLGLIAEVVRPANR
jgi:glycosyltransferase involved in cell wall biosynthesis